MTLPGPVKLFLSNPFVPAQQKIALSTGLQNSLQGLFSRYNLTAKTWAALTRESEHSGAGARAEAFREDGHGLLRRGAMRYQLLVPSYLVMFAFFLVLTVGWLFVAGQTPGPAGKARRVFHPLVSLPVRVEGTRVSVRGPLFSATSSA